VAIINNVEKLAAAIESMYQTAWHGISNINVASAHGGILKYGQRKP